MVDHLRLLILEDRPADAELMLHEIQQAGFEPVWHRIDTEADYLAHLDPALDAILADFTLPQFDAMRALKLLQERDLDIPFIVVSGSISDEAAVECIKQGAADYLLKDRLARLGPALKQILNQKRLRDAKRRSDEALQESERRYRRLVELSPDGIAVYSETRIVFVNKTGAKLLGSSKRETLIGRSILDFICVEDGDCIDPEQQIETWTATAQHEQTFIRLDGSVIDVEVEAVPLSYQSKPAVQLVFRDITKRKQAKAALQRQFKELSALHAVATAGAEATHVDELLERVTRIIGQMLYPDNFGIALIDKPVNLLRTHPSYQGLDEDGRELASPLEQGVTGQVIATGQSRRIPDVTREPSYVGIYPDMRSELCVPLKVGEQIIGVINAESKQPDAFNEADERLLMTVAGQLATAIDRLRLFETIHRRANELEALAEVSSALRKAPTRADMLPIILDKLCHLIKSDGAALFIRDPATQEAVIELNRGSGTDVTGLRIPPGQGIGGHVIATGRPYLTSDIRNDPHTYRPDRVDGVQGAACVPLIALEQTIGALLVRRRSDITPDELRLMVAMANTAANAIYRATLYEETQRHLQRLAALRHIDMAINVSTELSVIFKLLLEQVTAQLNVDAGCVLLYDPETETLNHAANYGFHFGAITATCLRLGEGYPGRAALDRETVSISDLAHAPDFARAGLLTQEAFVAYYAVPLLAKGRLEGILEIFHRAPLQPNPEWVDFLEGVATQAAIAIENAQLLAESRRLLDRTRRQARQVDQILDTVPEGMLLLDAKQRIVLANPLAREYLPMLTDMTLGDILTQLAGRPLEELLHAPPEGLGHELEIAGPPSRIFEVDARTVETGPQAGGWVMVLRNVTHEREIQQRAQQQERLAAVGQLAAGIAHDFNNILTVIIGFAELARYYHDIDTRLQEIMDRIIKQGKQAGDLIRQIMDFGRQSVTEKYFVDLVPVVHEHISLLERIIPENIRIELDIKPGKYTLKADPTQIQQVLTNLAVNARDAMLDGGTLIFELYLVTFTPGERLPCPDLSPGEWIALAVSDTGSGIAPEIMPHLFEPFFTTKEINEGAGLGLAQVYGIVKQHGGDVEVNSRPGQGAAFTLYLPVSTKPGAGRLQPVSRNVPAGNGELILLVEDDVVVLDVIQRLLLSLKYQVITAGNGQEGLAIYENHQADIALVLTDVTMPKMGGVALVQALRERNPDIKVVVMTGYRLEAEIKGLLSQGFAARLQKPLTVQQVAQTVHQALKGSID
jgi:PAS domain S-box-containing protein